MRNIALHLVLFSILLSPAVCSAKEVSLGTTAIEVPNPPGFAVVTEQMKFTYDVQHRFVPPVNEFLLGYLPEANVADALAGKKMGHVNYCLLEASKALMDKTVTSADFVTLKDAIKTQNEQLVKKAQAQIPGLIDKAANGVAKDYHMKFSISGLQTLPLPAHDETDRSISYSLYVNLKAETAQGEMPITAICTITFVHAKGKVLFLYVYGTDKDLEWTRTVSKQWAQSILSANPSGVLAKLGATNPLGRNGNEILIIAAIALGLIAIFAILGKLQRRS